MNNLEIFCEKFKYHFNCKPWIKNGKNRVYIDTGKKDITAYMEWDEIIDEKDFNENVNALTSSKLSVYSEKSYDQKKWWFEHLSGCVKTAFPEEIAQIDNHQ